MIVSQFKTINAIRKTNQNTENEKVHLTSILSFKLLYQGYICTVMKLDFWKCSEKAEW